MRGAEIKGMTVEQLVETANSKRKTGTRGQRAAPKRSRQRETKRSGEPCDAMGPIKGKKKVKILHLRP